MLFLYFAAVSLCAYAAEVKENEKSAEPEQGKEKRQAQDSFVPSHFVYRPTRKQVQRYTWEVYFILKQYICLYQIIEND